MFGSSWFEVRALLGFRLDVIGADSFMADCSGILRYRFLHKYLPILGAALVIMAKYCFVGNKNRY